MPDRPLDNINDALQNPEIAEAFRKHLKSEFSDENFEFHEKMTQFAKDVQNPAITDQQLRDKAVQIYQEHVSTDAVRQVNVSSDQVGKIRDAMVGIDTASRKEVADMLDESHKEIVNLMGRDSLRRFHATGEFTAAKEQANKTLDAAEKTLEQLRTRERQLKLNPSLGDKAKAMVTSGGMVTLIRDVERQKEALEQQIKERTQQLPVIEKINNKPTTPKVTAPPIAVPPVVTTPTVAPLDLEAGVVGRGRSNAADASQLPTPEPQKPSVREAMGGKDASKVGVEKSLAISSSDSDASKMSVKDKIKLFEGGSGSSGPSKRGVK
jgi:hypothetical protein